MSSVKNAKHNVSSVNEDAKKAAKRAAKNAARKAARAASREAKTVKIAGGKPASTKMANAIKKSNGSPVSKALAFMSEYALIESGQVSNPQYNALVKKLQSTETLLISALNFLNETGQLGKVNQAGTYLQGVQRANIAVAKAQETAKAKELEELKKRAKSLGHMVIEDANETKKAEKKAKK